MKIAVYSITRDRLAFTKHCFQTLREKAGVPFDHYVVDNGSTDGSKEWVATAYGPEFFMPFNENLGISKASNCALLQILKKPYDLVCKVDNDCEAVSENILGQMAEIVSMCPPLGPRYVLSPRVEGIVNQPKRVRDVQLGGRRVGLTSIVGGIFHCVPADIYRQYRYPETLPLGAGQDDDFCAWARAKGCEVGYVEGLVVNHYLTTDGQPKAEPSYFERKWAEAKL